MSGPGSGPERSPKFSRIPSLTGESKIPRPGFLAKSNSLARGTPSPRPRPSSANGAPEPSRRPTRATENTYRFSEEGSGEAEGDASPGSDRILVAVRLRSLSEKERTRGDREVWTAVDDHTIAVKEGGQGMKVKFAFDHVLGNTSTNKQVYSRTAKGVVAAAMDGLNATVFAYGVTSSGKTYTMMGSHEDPGIVQRALRDVFRAIQQTPERDFLLRFSMMEIYNEVLNDLLDPSRANLKLREDPSKGFFVEGIKEETLVSVEHALSVIAAGDANRKVSATAFNEGSSRSHTIMRLTIESSERPGPEADPRLRVARTLSFLNLIDLAGSESAKATLTKGHVREGSFINKSLLTLGSVIAKLSDGAAIHIPFRDSKLTKLLQSSMTGSGARVCVLATATPASSQAEETHNTLKFATRAKKIEIKAQRNEILDQSSLIMRYQAEIADLRRQLEEAAQGKGVALVVDPLHPEVRNLRERLEEEHQALLQREQDKVALEARIVRLTRVILHSTRIPRPALGTGARYRHLLLSQAQAGELADPARRPHIASLDGHRSSDAGSERSGPHTPLPKDFASPWRRSHDSATDTTSLLTGESDTPAWDRTPDVAAAVASIRSAGDIFAGSGLLNQLHTRYALEGDSDAELLREQLRVIADELEKREGLIEELQAGGFGAVDEDQEVELQIMAAEREFLESRLKLNMGRQQQFAGHIQVLRQQLLAAGLVPEVGPVRLDDDEDSTAGDEEAVPQLSRAPQAAGSTNESPARGGGLALADARQEVERLEEQVEAARQELSHRDSELKAELKAERAKLQRVMEREQHVESQLKQNARETGALRNELKRLEALTNNLQGYGLEGMSDSELAQLIVNLTQAIERVKVTAQMRQMAQPVPNEVEAPRTPAKDHTVETRVGPYAPMRRGMGSLAKAVSNLSSVFDGK